MEGKPNPLHILHELNNDFQRSKKEQIDRFLRDQDELNKRFTDCDLNDDCASVKADEDEEEEEDSSDDVESQFNLRLDTFRVRPLSARIGSWSLEDDETNKSSSKPFATVRLSNKDEHDMNTGVNVVDQKEYQKYARDRLSSRDRKVSSRPRRMHNGNVRERNKDRSVKKNVDTKDKQHEHTDRNTDKHAETSEQAENQPQKKLLVRRRHRPRTAMGLQIASRDVEESTLEHSPSTSPKKDTKKPVAASGTGPSSSRRPLRASAPAAVTRGHAQPTAWETAEEVKRNTYLERQTVVRGGRESPAPNTMGASLHALHHRNRQQELLASGSASNLTPPSSNTITDPASSLRNSLNFGNSTPRSSVGGTSGKDAWATLGTPRARPVDSLLSGSNTARGNTGGTLTSSQTSASSPTSSQGTKLSHRKVGQGGPSEGGVVRTQLSLIKLPRLEGTLPKTMLQSKDSPHGFVANTPT